MNGREESGGGGRRREAMQRRTARGGDWRACKAVIWWFVSVGGDVGGGRGEGEDRLGPAALGTAPLRRLIPQGLPPQAEADARRRRRDVDDRNVAGRAVGGVQLAAPASTPMPTAADRRRRWSAGDAAARRRSPTPTSPGRSTRTAALRPATAPRPSAAAASLPLRPSAAGLCRRGFVAPRLAPKSTHEFSFVTNTSRRPE